MDNTDDLGKDTGDPDANNAPNWQEWFNRTDPDDPCSDDRASTKLHDAWSYDLNCVCQPKTAPL